MSNFNVLSEIKTLVNSIKGLKKSRETLKQSLDSLEQNALEREIKHRSKMMDIEVEHELRMQMYDEQALAQTALQESKMKVFNDAEAAREVMSSRIDTLMIQLKDKNVIDKEAVLLELHKVNNEMHEIAMKALRA